MLISADEEGATATSDSDAWPFAPSSRRAAVNVALSAGKARKAYFARKELPSPPVGSAQDETYWGLKHARGGVLHANQDERFRMRRLG